MKRPTGTLDPWEQPNPESGSTPAEPRKRPTGNRWVFGVVGLVIGLAVGLISGQLSSGSTSARGPLGGSSHAITDAVADCGVEDAVGVTVMDEGASLHLSTAGEESSGAEYSDVMCVLAALEVPDSVTTRFGTTSAMDGQQTANWNGYSASWGYHPDTGLDVVVETRPQD